MKVVGEMKTKNKKTVPSKENTCRFVVRIHRGETQLLKHGSH